MADDSARIAVVDYTLTEKGGHYTYDLNWFYNGMAKRSEPNVAWNGRWWL